MRNTEPSPFAPTCSSSFLFPTNHVNNTPIVTLSEANTEIGKVKGLCHKPVSAKSRTPQHGTGNKTVDLWVGEANNSHLTASGHRSTAILRVSSAQRKGRSFSISDLEFQPHNYPCQPRWLLVVCGQTVVRSLTHLIKLSDVACSLHRHPVLMCVCESVS